MSADKEKKKIHGLLFSTQVVHSLTHYKFLSYMYIHYHPLSYTV